MFTRIQINLWFLCLLLVVLQGAILWLMNGDLQELIRNKDLDVLALIFSPTAGIIWIAKQMTPYQNGKEKDDE